MAEGNKNPEQYREFLRAGRWFGGLTEELQGRLLALGTVRRFGAGQRLFSRGDPPDGLYAVLSGVVLISTTAENGKEALLTLAEPPAWMGEIAVFDEQPRTHDATADGEVLVLYIAQAPLHGLLNSRPALWRQLALLATAKLRLTFLAMEEIALYPLSVRLARRLVLMAEAYGEFQDRSRAVLEVRQEQLALMLSTSRQTVNQLLKELEAQGLIQLAYGRVELRDLEGLRRMATP